MIRRQSLFTLVLVGTAAWAAARPASAELFTTANAINPIASSKTDWTGTLSFGQFDSSLGTLTKVRLNLDSDLITKLTVTNNSDAVASITGDVYTSVNLAVEDTTKTIKADFGVSSAKFGFTLAAKESTSSGDLTSDNSKSFDYTSAEVLSLFTGTGDIDFNASTKTETWLSSTGGNTTVAQETYASLDGSVTYFYTPVPEPSTLVLLGTLSAVLVGVWFRRARC